MKNLWNFIAQALSENGSPSGKRITLFIFCVLAIFGYITATFTKLIMSYYVKHGYVNSGDLIAPEYMWSSVIYTIWVCIGVIGAVNLKDKIKLPTSPPDADKS